MIENFKGKENTNGFDQRPKDSVKGGRRKRLYHSLKDQGFSKEDVRECYAFIADCTKSDLNKILESDNATALEITVAQAFLKAMEKGDYKLIKDIVELFADKPKQGIDHSGQAIEPIKIINIGNGIKPD